MTTVQTHPRYDETTCDQCGLVRVGAAPNPLMVQLTVITRFGTVGGDFHSSQCAQQFVARAINNAFNMEGEMIGVLKFTESELRLLDGNR
jgi:hypothetical protein